MTCFRRVKQNQRMEMIKNQPQWRKMGIVQGSFSYRNGVFKVSLVSWSKKLLEKEEGHQRRIQPQRNSHSEKLNKVLFSY